MTAGITVFLAPEALVEDRRGRDLIDTLRANNMLGMLVVDEAHNVYTQYVWLRVLLYVVDCLSASVVQMRQHVTCHVVYAGAPRVSPTTTARHLVQGSPAW